MKQKKKTTHSIDWQAPEFEYYRKGKSWFLVSAIIAALLFVWALWNGNILFAFIIGLAYFSLFTYALKKPRDIKIAISGEGIRVDQALYEYEGLSSFWIFYDPPLLKEISLRSRKRLLPYIKIPLGRENPVEIRKILIKYLPEKRHKESLVDNLTRSIRF